MQRLSIYGSSPSSEVAKEREPCLHHFRSLSWLVSHQRLVHRLLFIPLPALHLYISFKGGSLSGPCNAVASLAFLRAFLQTKEATGLVHIVRNEVADGTWTPWSLFLYRISRALAEVDGQGSPAYPYLLGPGRLLPTLAVFISIQEFDGCIFCCFLKVAIWSYRSLRPLFRPIQRRLPC